MGRRLTCARPRDLWANVIAAGEGVTALRRRPRRHRHAALRVGRAGTCELWGRRTCVRALRRTPGPNKDKGLANMIRYPADWVSRHRGIGLAIVGPLMCAGITTYFPLKRHSNPSDKVALLGLADWVTWRCNLASRAQDGCFHRPASQRRPRRKGSAPSSLFVGGSGTDLMWTPTKALSTRSSTPPHRPRAVGPLL